MRLEDLHGKRILIVGYGVEGKATERFLREMVPDATIGIADKNDGENYLDKQMNYDIVIRSPGIPKRLISKPYTTATNLFFSMHPGTIIGVTGTKGKSTTTSLIHHLLTAGGVKAVLAGNIGKPMLEAYLEHQHEEVVYVVELSSYMLDDIDYSPDYAVVVSLYPEHIDYHGSVQDYYAAKHRILDHATSNSTYAYNPTFPELRQWANSYPGTAVAFDLNFAIDQSTTPLIGPHNLQNMQGAATVARAFGITDSAIRESLPLFHPLPHRLQRVGTFHDITFYDDAISTTPESTMQALASLPQVGTIFLGGLDRGYDFTELARTLTGSGIRNFVFFPESGPTIRAILEKHTTGFNALETRSMQEAVAFAYKHTPPGQICLLSTASPSYSIWKNFEEKGDEFQKWVRSYAETHQKETSIN